MYDSLMRHSRARATNNSRAWSSSRGVCLLPQKHGQWSCGEVRGSNSMHSLGLHKTSAWPLGG